MKLIGIENKFLRYIRNIILILLVFYVASIVGYVILGKGNIVDALTLKSIRHIKEIIYN